ncbi:MAG TPA: alcohol dehydrogenase catalytic domain-containing protein [Candidatus Anaerotruncus excrementipullorum]|mgnify:CR=1 FL=1|uniref:Alcohol dehydrogenase catalytic domain-containing protein n=1 Tax=Candidatus Anaerotruncus excrementipullorum TaxID=2838465 RepID=A0A9D1WSF0_9FIRM|nr:alcohol dehydrogenase catalytic domain-containing protein [Candidatus Anaerotruncus excrementipullorum]
MKYKILVMEDIGKLNIREAEVPKPGKGELLVKVKNCNICTTDWQNWNGSRGKTNKKFPYAPGHEAAGIVEEVGPGVTLYQPGDYIAVGYAGCGYCVECKKGNTVHCQNGTSTTIDDVTGGFGMSQYVVIRAAEAFKMNPEIPYEVACYLEPVSTSIHGIKKLNVQAGDSLLVIGAGNLGLVNAQVARAAGCRTFVSEVNPQRIEIAKSLGFEVMNPNQDDILEFADRFTNGYGVDHVVVAVGNTPATEQAFKVVKFAGKVLLFAAGYPSPELNLNVNQVHYGNWHIIGTGGSDVADFQLACQYLNDGTVKVDKLLSQTLPLEEYQRAFELAATPGTYRVSISLWDE